MYVEMAIGALSRDVVQEYNLIMPILLKKIINQCSINHSWLLARIVYILSHITSYKPVASNVTGTNVQKYKWNE